jgi:hypothetical protein
LDFLLRALTARAVPRGGRPVIVAGDSVAGDVLGLLAGARVVRS